MPRSLVRFAPLLLLVFGAAACSGEDDTGEPAATTPPHDRTFLSTEVEGEPIPGGGPLTLTFGTDRISANAGCNTASGTVAFEGDVMQVGQLASTLMGCTGDTAGADQWVDTLLSSNPTWRLDGDTLTLRNADQTVTLLDKKVADPDRPIQGTTWVVTGLITPDAHIRSQALDDAKPTLTIAEDGGLTGTAGCNRMMGTAAVEPGPDSTVITFRAGTTKMMCAPEVMEVETAVLQALDGRTTATVDANQLTLRNDNGHGLTLTAQ